VHGANRLGGNSLLETVVFGKIAGQTISNAILNISTPSLDKIREKLDLEKKRINAFYSRDAGEPMHVIRNELKTTMFTHFGIFREEKRMEEGLRKIKELKNRFRSVSIESNDKIFNQALIHTLELENMLLIAEPVGKGALARQESRGSHSRTDYPQRDDAKYLAHTMAYCRKGKTELEYVPVNLGIFPVKERVY